MAKQLAPSVERNRDDILTVLRRALPREGLVLEVASGTAAIGGRCTSRVVGTRRGQYARSQMEKGES